MANQLPNGQFSKGNKASGGNPFAAQVARFRTIIVARLEDADYVPDPTRTQSYWGKIVDKWIIDAFTGDKDARKLLVSYVLGKPTETVYVYENDVDFEDVVAELRKRNIVVTQAPPESESK